MPFWCKMEEHVFAATPKQDSAVLYVFACCFFPLPLWFNTSRERQVVPPTCPQVNNLKDLGSLSLIKNWDLISIDVTPYISTLLLEVRLKVVVTPLDNSRFVFLCGPNLHPCESSRSSFDAGAIFLPINGILFPPLAIGSSRWRS